MTHVAVVCHDAGGAEILSSWLNRQHCPASVSVAGPAEDIFRRKCPRAEFLPLEFALAKCTWVLSGTGWQSSFEREAIARGRTLGKKTVAFLDHWVNYLERFDEAGHSVLPDELWVGDVEAERIARAQFDATPVVLHPNPYFEDLLAEIARGQAISAVSTTSRILYICEPVSVHASAKYGNERHFGYTEYEALRYFLTNMTALGQRIDAIAIRPHPSEPVDKYRWARDLVPLPVECSRKRTLVEETLAADIVIGCESMGMVVGLLAGKRVISAIPPGGRDCQLPHREIEHMRLLIEGFLKLD